MFDVSVTRELDKPVEAVFAMMADHAGYGRFPGIQDARLEEPGTSEPNGVGALRWVHLGQAQVWERILEYAPNERLAYRVERGTPVHIDHEGGQLDFERLSDTRCRVTWSTRGHVAIPLLGRLIDKLVQRQMRSAFEATLGWVGKHA